MPTEVVVQLYACVKASMRKVRTPYRHDAG